MTLNLGGITTAVADHARVSGLFAKVNGYEPKVAPARGGITCGVWVEWAGPYPRRSGLAATTAVVRLNVRLFTSMLAEPQDAIDPALMAAVDYLMGAYSGDFTLGGTVANVDLLGAAGPALFAQAGYIDQDHRLYRVMTITLPLVVNDLWAQAP